MKQPVPKQVHRQGAQNTPLTVHDEARPIDVRAQPVRCVDSVEVSVTVNAAPWEVLPWW